ncbi:MAG: AAA family ATPase [Oscillospiraceae bacterium]|nr:AAA family ATPase [Oscillospiraceae bacterium]MDD4413419.1 AAA family ATPase [Oscillospiraceae bacterium]
MTEVELTKIFQKSSSAIIAPAGHGKTEMIADIVEHSTGKQLLLTHTNVGVDALEKRLKKRSISKEKYTVTTIAAFCIKWCVSYGNTGVFDKTLSPLSSGTEAKKYYAQLYNGAKKIFETSWAGNVLKATYSGIVVDEYQDCIQEQHKIVLAMNHHLPVIVLGDPMQGIFSFAGNLVDWNHLEFPIVDVATKPWRWLRSNPDLGKYLMAVRETLLPTLTGQHCNLQISSTNESVKIINPADFTGYSHLKELSQFSSVVYITQWPTQQLNFCSRMPGIFQFDEKQDCDELFKYAKQFDTKSGATLVLMVIKFVADCSTGLGKELESYIKRLKSNSFDFSRIKKHTDFREILEKSAPDISRETVLKMLVWFSTNSTFKQYRTELLSEMIRSIIYAIQHDLTIFDAAYHIRKDSSLQKRYTGFKFLSSRTLLSKGLEYDCVIIDMITPLSAKDFYVAMTRAMKKIYIISASDTFQF